MSTDVNRPEKKERVRITYAHCMAKLSIKHLFISCGKYIVLEWHIHMFWLTNLIDH